jgi:hypothetical protein
MITICESRIKAFKTAVPRALILAFSLALAAAPLPSFAQQQEVTLPVAEQMKEIYEIQQLKARYFRLMDTKCWADWSEVFTDDATVTTTAFGVPVVWTGKDEILSQNSTTLAEVLSVHHGHMPEIKLTSDTTATGIWAMEDHLEFPNGIVLNGAGHYHEEYVKQDGAWKIRSLNLTRIKESISTATN